MTEFVASRDGVKIAYSMVGRGLPIVLVHGFASDRVQNWKAPGWYDTLTAAGFRVIAFDCRGHGESDKPHDSGFYGDKMPDDVLAVMDAAGVPVADVMGYSMGGMLTIALLMSHPERLRSAVVAGVGESYFHDMPERRRGIAAALRAGDPSTIENSEQRAFREFAQQAGKDLAALAACMSAERTTYTGEQLRTVTRPVLVVAGEKDIQTGSPVPLAQAFGIGRAVIVPRRDHMTAVGDKAYKQAVLDFLRT